MCQFKFLGDKLAAFLIKQFNFDIKNGGDPLSPILFEIEEMLRKFREVGR